MLRFLSPTARENALAAENRRLLDRIAALDRRLDELESANQAQYRADYDATGGPRFDPGQPFGTPTTARPGPSPFGWKSGVQR
ncbi:hypothetical protein ACFWPV_10115 [Streptomyces uncialis]|uniref:hypothetical protein n=1 Tax=Streptomyces uncialis TaxID=1048205 RepID=UPI00366851C0